MFFNEIIGNCLVNHIEALPQKREGLAGPSSTPFKLCDLSVCVWTLLSLFSSSIAVLAAPALRAVVTVTRVSRVKPWKQYLLQTSAGYVLPVLLSIYTFFCKNKFIWKAVGSYEPSPKTKCWAYVLGCVYHFRRSAGPLKHTPDAKPPSAPAREIYLCISDGN